MKAKGTKQQARVSVVDVVALCNSHAVLSQAHCRRLWLVEGENKGFRTRYPHVLFAGPSEGPRPPSVSVWTTDEGLGQCLTLAHREDSVRFATGLEAHRGQVCWPNRSLGSAAGPGLQRAVCWVRPTTVHCSRVAGGSACNFV